ncbi:MAG: hypothetical protein KDD82_00740 [Planctomycetes bacterium]|nr:hypothetical protein [Planctomycetota bacterium]
MPHTIETTPTSEENLTVACFCGRRYAVPRRLSGRQIRCGRCKTALRVGPAQAKRAPAPRGIDRTAKQLGAPEASNDPYAPPREVQRDRPQGQTPPTSKEFMRDRDLTAEGHVMAMGLWTRVWGLLLGLGALAFVVFGLPKASGAAAAFLLVGAVFALGWAGFTILLGTHLMGLRNWARIVFAVLSGLQLLNFGLQLLTEPFPQKLVSLIVAAWVCAQLWALFGEAGARVFQPDYQARRARDPRSVAFWWSPFFIVPAVLLALFVVGALFVVLRLAV